jgi:two-component system sensor kinase FixL
MATNRGLFLMEMPFRPDREATRILAAIVEASQDAIVGKDLDGIILTWNRAAERMYGYTADEMVGRSIRTIIPPDRLAEFDAIMRRIAAGDYVDPFDTVRLTKDGRRLEVSLAVSPIHDQPGSVVGASAIARDITAARRAERELRDSGARWRAVVDAAEDAFVVIDARGQIESFNRSAERLFGFTSGEVIGQNVKMLMLEDEAKRHDGYLERFSRTSERRIIGIGREVEGRRKDGRTFPLHLAVTEISVDGQPRFVGTLRDLTERRRLEAQLQEESGLARLGELAAVLAHEIRNPLAAVSGAIQMLSEHLPTEEDREITGEILQRLDGLSELMNDLLLYARPPRPQILRVEVWPLVESLVALFAADPAWANVRTSIRGEPLVVAADPELLKIALQNLLLNAVQAMRGQGNLIVQLRAAGAEAEIDIIDSGPGIPPEVAERLFTPFFTTKARGTGLGLPTARRIAQSHGGEVRVFQTSAAGTTMKLVIQSARDEGSPLV